MATKYTADDTISGLRGFAADTLKERLIPRNACAGQTDTFF